MLKFLQRLALDFSFICLQFFPGLPYRQMYRKFKKVVLSLLAHVTPSIFFSRILRSEALVYHWFFFQNRGSTEIISTLDFHTNIVICHAFAYSQDGVENRDKVLYTTKPERFYDFFYIHKMHLLALLGFLTDWNDRFPYPLIYLTSGIPTLSYTWRLK